MKCIKRNGSVVDFDAGKIKDAMYNAFMEVDDGSIDINSTMLDALTSEVVGNLTLSKGDTAIGVEEIQDCIEMVLGKRGFSKVLHVFVVYREKRNEARKGNKEVKLVNVTGFDNSGELRSLPVGYIGQLIIECCKGIDHVNPDEILSRYQKNLYEGISFEDVYQSLIMTARSLIEDTPEYTYVTARLLLRKVEFESFNYLKDSETSKLNIGQTSENYCNEYFDSYLEQGIVNKQLSTSLYSKFNTDVLAEYIKPERDNLFDFLGLSTLYDRYLLHKDGVRYEMPQWMFMRVAMGLSLNEDNPTERAKEFYDLLSQHDYMTSTPTLFNAGTLRPQLSSCYLTTIPDDLEGIYDGIKENAMLSKWAGGLGNDWSSVRGLGSRIQGTNGKSQGTIPFLKVVNDTAVAVNQGGKRKGAVCAYLETWHIDIPEFLDLRKNTGDDRRRTHDMNIANWIPDLFMERVLAEKDWTLFCPSEVPELHEVYGNTFRSYYEDYELKAQEGLIKNFKVVKAKDLWRKMLSALFETGHPWITFKDPCNLRSPQQHVGVVHSSNLCTEITLNTSADEIAVCNLGSVNLSNHILSNGKLNYAKLYKTVKTAIRMLDNVIDINYYAVDKARRSNLRHRPIGLGMMGLQDLLYKKGVAIDSEESLMLSDNLTQAISYYAIEASADLAQERGSYPSFIDSYWSSGILPIDTIDLVKDSRKTEHLLRDELGYLIDEGNWLELREKVKKGMRNSNVMAIAPTATIANICGVTQSIEPMYQNLFVKSNLGGEFTVVNPYLVKELRKLGVWDKAMVEELKYFDGSVQYITRIPKHLKEIFKTAFEADPFKLLYAAAFRQKWIDQAQSLNAYIKEPSGKLLDQYYTTAWKLGIKTTYYLRAMGATSVEKSTVSKGTLNSVSPSIPTGVCSIDNPDDCEACQ